MLYQQAGTIIGAEQIYDLSLLRPFRALLFGPPITQGCALGYYITPLRGVQSNRLGNRFPKLLRDGRLRLLNDNWHA
jgi:hypothetical protein